MVGLIRARVPRFHPSMWLDGVIGALGTTALGVAFLLGPYLHPADGREAVALINLAMPVMDVLLLALLVAVGSILGLRMDRSLLRRHHALLLVLPATSSSSPAWSRAPMWTAARPSSSGSSASASPRSPHTAPVPGRQGLRALPRRAAAARPPADLQPGQPVRPPAGWGDSLPSAAAWLAIGCVSPRSPAPRSPSARCGRFHEVEQQARTDELTGLANRRALLDTAARVLTTASARRPAALLLLDLDGFKEVNDSLGHAAGDHLLRQIGPRLQPALRPGELLARLGGDEFAVLLPQATLDEAQERAERLRKLRPPAVPRRGHPAARGGQHRRRHRPGAGGHRAGAAALRRRRDVRGEVRAARACTSTCRTRTAAAATGCARWRSCAPR